MKELVFILPDKNGGVASVVYNLLRYNSCGYSTKVILLQLVENDKYNNNISYTFPCNEQIVIRYSAADPKYKVINRIAKHLNDNSIMISNDGNLELATVYFKKISIPVIYILHGDMRYYFNIMKKYEPIIDQVICVSSYLKTRIKQENINLHSLFIPFPIPAFSKYDKCYNSANLNIIYAGSLDERKGVKYFPSYTKSLEALGVCYKFDIIGIGNYLPYLKHEYANNNNVIIHGYMPNSDVFKLLKDAHILLLFSKEEGLPVCVVEAMKHGAVPIVFDIPSGVPDIIDSGKNGFIVPQMGIDEAAKITKRLFDDRAGLQKIGQCGLAKAEAMFDPIVQANAYINTIVSTIPKQKKYSISIKKQIANYVPSQLIYKLDSLKRKLRK